MAKGKKMKKVSVTSDELAKTAVLLDEYDAAKKVAALRPAIPRTTRVLGDDFKFNLGDEIRDTVTGVEGVIVGREDCITGCSRMHLQPKSSKGHDMPNGYMIDQDRLELLKEVGARPFEIAKAGAPATERLMETR